MSIYYLKVDFNGIFGSATGGKKFNTIDPRTTTTSTPLRTSTSSTYKTTVTAATTTATTTTIKSATKPTSKAPTWFPETNLVTQIIVVDSLHLDPEKQISEIFNKVLASQSGDPVTASPSSSGDAIPASQSDSSELQTSPSEMNIALADPRTEYSSNPTENEIMKIYHNQGELLRVDPDQQQPQRALHQNRQYTTSSPKVYKSTIVPFKPTGSTLNHEPDGNKPTIWSIQTSSEHDQNKFQEHSRPGTWSLVSPNVYAEPTKATYGEIYPRPFLEGYNNRNPGQGDLMYADITPTKYLTEKNYAEISSTSKSTQVFGTASWPQFVRDTTTSKPGTNNAKLF